MRESAWKGLGLGFSCQLRRVLKRSDLLFFFFYVCYLLYYSFETLIVFKNKFI